MDPFKRLLDEEKADRRAEFRFGLVVLLGSVAFVALAWLMQQ